MFRGKLTSCVTVKIVVEARLWLLWLLLLLIHCVVYCMPTKGAGYPNEREAFNAVYAIFFCFASLFHFNY